MATLQHTIYDKFVKGKHDDTPTKQENDQVEKEYLLKKTTQIKLLAACASDTFSWGH